ncbi:MAG TPA: alkaline phosphatase, partial [Burkholderiaceae bacterium]|nr:alkaline phosphatase [Burkholderiaceae bacterium]
MSQTMSSTPTRRQALKFLGAPLMLPLGGMAASSLLTACGGGDDSPAPTFVSASFAAMAAPTLSDPAGMAKTLVASSLDVTLSDN